MTSLKNFSNTLLVVISVYISVAVKVSLNGLVVFTWELLFLVADDVLFGGALLILQLLVPLATSKDTTSGTGLVKVVFSVAKGRDIGGRLLVLDFSESSHVTRRGHVNLAVGLLIN